MTGKQLKKRREKMGWSQLQLATLLEVRRSMISLWERGQSPIPDSVAFSLAEAITGKQLKQKREDMNLSQQRLGEILNVRQATISDWERGVHPIPKSVVLAIAEIERRESVNGSNASADAKAA